MRLFSSYYSPRVNLFSGNSTEFDEWCFALRRAGLRVSSPKGTYTSYNLEKELLLILDPEYSADADLFIQKHINHLHNLYIVSNEPYWKRLNEQYSFNLLTKETHPLETARLVVHSAKASPKNYFARYASLFNF